MKDIVEFSRLHVEAMAPDGSGLRRAPGDTHAWIIETVDGGGLGDGFWACPACGAFGSPFWAKDPRTPEPFLAGPAIRLPLDCAMAAEVVRKWREESC